MSLVLQRCASFPQSYVACAPLTRTYSAITLADMVGSDHIFDALIWGMNKYLITVDSEWVGLIPQPKSKLQDLVVVTPTELLRVHQMMLQHHPHHITTGSWWQVVRLINALDHHMCP